MQPVVVGTRRRSGPILNALLVLVILTAAVGAVCVGIGAKIGDNFNDVSHAGSSFWWGGVVLLILALLYVPAHVLLKMSFGAGRAMFLFWTFCVGIGVIVVFASAIISLVLLLIVNLFNVNNCLYYVDANQQPVPPSTLCKPQCDTGLREKLDRDYKRVCCCCDTTYDAVDYKIAYAQGVSSCSLFTDSFDLARALFALYFIGLLLTFIDMVLAYIIGCGCCAVETPWFQPITMVTTTTFGSGQTSPPSYQTTAFPSKKDFV